MGIAVALAVSATASAAQMISVSNRGDAEIAETRAVEFTNGEAQVHWGGVSTRLDLDSVRFAVTAEAKPIQTTGLELQYDGRNRDLLLRRYLGKTVVLVRPETHERVSGTVLDVERGQVSMLRTDAGELWLNPAGEVLLPPNDSLALTPTLTCRLGADLDGSRDVQLTYRTNGLPWHVIYTCTYDDATSTADLAAVLLLKNETGVDYKDASCRIFAIERRRIDALQPVEVEQVVEYQPPGLDKPVSLAADETLRLQFLTAARLPVETVYYFDPLTSGPAVNVPEQKLQQAIVIANSEHADSAGLGSPLPGGKVKLCVRRSGSLLQPLGDRHIPFIDTDEALEIPFGAASGLFGKRTQTPFVEFADQRAQEQDITIDLRNETDVDVSATVIEHPWGRWSVPQTTAEFEKINNETIEFRALIPAHGKTQIRYRLRIAY